MTDKDFLTHDNQINKTWKHYWKERLYGIPLSRRQQKEVRHEKSDARRRVNRFIRRSAKNWLRELIQKY